MRIGIDISPVIYGTGVSVYTKNLVESLLAIDSQNQYLLFGGSLRRLSELKELSRKMIANYQSAETKFLSLPPTFLDLLWNQLHVLAIENLTGPLDIFHASDWVQPPAKKAKLIATLHDLSFLRWPKTVHPKVLQAQKRRLEWVKKEAAAIICVSQATKNEAIELLKIPEDKLFVIYEGTPQEAIIFASKEKNLPKLKALKLRLGISKPYFYAYGSQAPRKNIPRIVEAFKSVSKSLNYQLVISGEYQPEDKLPQEVILTGFLPREEMLTLLSGAEALVFPSIYEGFGLIILEAFILGVPVVTANVSSMPEVAGKAAVLVDPLKVDAIAQGMKKAIQEKKTLIKAGLRQTQKFSWQKTAQKTLKVYEKVAGLH